MREMKRTTCLFLIATALFGLGVVETEAAKLKALYFGKDA